MSLTVIILCSKEMVTKTKIYHCMLTLMKYNYVLKNFCIISFALTFASLKDTDKEKDINLKSVNVQKEENEHNLWSLVS